MPNPSAGSVKLPLWNRRLACGDDPSMSHVRESMAQSNPKVERESLHMARQAQLAAVIADHQLGLTRCIHAVASPAPDQPIEQSDA